MRSFQSVEAWKVRNLAAWASDLKPLPVEFTVEEANHVWCRDISTARYRLRQLLKAGYVEKIAAVFWPKPLPWRWRLTTEGNTSC